MHALSLDILLGLAAASAIIALLVVDAVKSTSRKRRHARDREGQRRKHWGYT